MNQPTKKRYWNSNNWITKSITYCLLTSMHFRNYVLSHGISHLYLTRKINVLERLTYLPCIVTNYINKPTRCAFCMYLFCNFCTNLHVSNDHFIRHQEFMIYCILQLCTNRANVSNCSVVRPSS